ncbi:MAG: sugar-transfer associated ATP-grasp domain-containing protein [Bacillota bacterium]|nr:sugar-transfer associated ATP-grasp domain-containing protein [Bacillota bacterium]
MISIKFLIRKLGTVNYSAFIKSAGRVSRLTGTPRIVVLKDIMSCVMKHGSGYVDYEAYEMYNMSENERSEFLTVGRNNTMVKELNQPGYRDYFDDKALFNEKFGKYLKRDWMVLNGENFEEFKQFCSDKDAFFMKPLDQHSGYGIEKLYMKDISDLHAEYDRLYSQGCILAEEVVTQCEEMSKLCTTSVNTIRLVTLLNRAGTKATVAAGAIRMGREGGFVDNFNHGGLAVILDVSKGESVTDGYDKERVTYIETPVLGTKLKGFKVPMWEECIKLVEEAALVVPEVRYVAWDVCVSDKYGPLLIEGNDYPGQDVTQYPKLGLGTYAAFSRILEELEN